MRQAGWSSSARFSIDEAVVDFWDWLEAKGNERTIGSEPERQPKKGQAWVPKYRNVGDILAEYGEPTVAEEAGIDRDELAAVIAELDAAHEPEF